MPESVTSRSSSVEDLRAPDCPIGSAALMYLDIETTGLHPERGAETTELGLLDGGGVRLHWRADSSDKPVANLLPQLIEQLSRGVVVGHHLEFDLGFLAHEAGRARQRGLRVRYIDTLALAKQHTDADETADYRLDSLVDALDLTAEPDDLHDALTDARTCRELLCTIARRHNLETLADAGLTQMSWLTI